MRNLLDSETEYLVKLVNESFETLGVTPYPWQEDAVYLILERFIYQAKKNVILSADTGVGKSMIGAAVVIAMAKFINDPHKPISNIMMHQNMLVDQYAASLEHLPDEFMRVKGASNYACVYDVENEPKATADDCKLKALRLEHRRAHKDDPDKPQFDIPIKCNACEYMKASIKAKFIPHTITNFQYHLARVLKANAPNKRVAAFDEAHTLSDVAVDALSIILDEDQFKKLELAGKYAEKQVDVDATTNGFGSRLGEFIDELDKIKQYTMTTGITELRFSDILQSLMDVLDPLIKCLRDERMLVPINYEGVVKAEKRLSSFYTSYKSYFDNKEHTEYVFDRNDAERIYQIKPVFVKGLADAILSDYNLFMSATITDEYMIETIGLKREVTDFIILPSVFPAENKPIYCIAKVAVSAKTLADPRTLQSLANDVTDIVRKHVKLGQNGVAFVNSFKMGEDLYNLLPNDVKKSVILHRKGEKVLQHVNAIKTTKKPMLLLSPSIFEGVDFKGKFSSYQIFLKAPFPSLGDKRIAVIAARYGNIYKTITLMKIIQGIGRSVRAANERAETYILDANIQTLLKSKFNVWRHTHVLHDSI